MNDDVALPGEEQRQDLYLWIRGCDGERKEARGIRGSESSIDR